MTRMLTKKIRRSFQCKEQLESSFGKHAFWSSIYDTEKQRILTLKRVVK